MALRLRLMAPALTAALAAAAAAQRGDPGIPNIELPTRAFWLLPPAGPPGAAAAVIVPGLDNESIPLAKFSAPGGATLPVVFRVRWLVIWWTHPGGEAASVRIRVRPHFFPPSPPIAFPWAAAPRHGAAVSVLDYPVRLEWVARLNLPRAWPILYELELGGAGAGRVELVVLIGELELVR